MSITIDGSNGVTFPDASVQAANALGVSQTYQDVTSSRTLGTTYTNTTGRPIYVYAWSNSNASGLGNNTMTINGIVFNSNYGSASNQTWVSWNIVPPGASYSMTMANGGPAKWYELR